ncbi:S9 family peptidase [Chitinophaga sp. MD30]|nr:S9 family peptidase [Chitinophaga sp. MD30]
MKKWAIAAPVLFLTFNSYSQQLSVEKIMRDPKWIGTSPSGATWSTDSKTIYFNWNPEQALADSLYAINIKDKTPRKVPAPSTGWQKAITFAVYNTARNRIVFAYNGDIYTQTIPGGKIVRITQTTTTESAPAFSFHDQQIIYRQGQDLYAWDIATGSTSQLTAFTKGKAPATPKLNIQEQWLKDRELEIMDVLKEKKEQKDAATAFNKLHKEKSLRNIYTDDKTVSNVDISPDGRFVTYRLFKSAGERRNTIVPEFVNESGYTTDIQARTNVGTPSGTYESFVFDREKDTVLPIHTNNLPGITTPPAFLQDYKKDTARPAPRPVIVNGPYWNEPGTQALVDVRSLDNKDRWIMLLLPATGTLSLIDHQHDDAWISGPGIGWTQGDGAIGWLNDQTCWYQSEATGYSHLYSRHINESTAKALTAGRFEVQDVYLTHDKKFFYIVTNEVHPGEKQLYRLPATGGKREKITTQEGAHEVTISPDEQWVAYRYSSSNQPWELFLQPLKAGASPIQLTSKGRSDEFNAYPWRKAEVITFSARDGEQVYARLYRPNAATKNGAAVIFVHGAGYLQNAHKWWSQYFREYMFHNLLADKGYTVLDIDYRASAGYGRNWRTGIYRYMGDKDLTDQLDGASYLTTQMGVDPKRIGIYGGSYGGFITLMAMFTQPDAFAAGAALRSVTDWAHYNHGYTSNILNEPFTDSIAYRRSSPIYHAAGLKGHLLMCHGMVDTNVHFQDIVRLTQRLIELGKDNWELAVYPVEDHGFITPSSWTDEYKRILKLFDNTLIKK